MANSSFDVLEFRAVIKPDFTELYILAGPVSEGMIGVQGWYKKTIPVSEPALPALEKALHSLSFLTDWDRGYPK